MATCLSVWTRALAAAALSFSLTLAGGCASSGAGGGSGDATPVYATSVYAAYVLLVESPDGETVPFARVIVDPRTPCPELAGKGPDGARERLVTTPRQNPHGFAVKVCEARYPYDRALAVSGGPQLPAVARSPARIAVFGDSGCKPNDQAGCGLDDPQWPFPRLIQAAVAEPPDLVLHVGDYNYRGTPSSFEKTVDGQQVKEWYYDAGDGAEPSERCEMPGPYYSQNSTGNPDADAWEAWWLDFFQPARDLLAAAPWVFARGNHELCSHAGPGWLYFLGPSSDLPAGGGRQLACPPQDGEGPALPHLRFVEPQLLDLGDFALIVLDSANACDELPGYTARYQQQLAAVAARLGGRRAWLMGHRPVWGLDGTATAAGYGCDGEPLAGPVPAYAALNVTLQCALAGETGAALLPAVDRILAGHMHRFETLSFVAGDRPPTLVVGNSGVAEETDPPVGAFAQTVDGAPASGFSVAQFGYLQLTKARDGWRGAVVTPDPAAWSPYLAPCADNGSTLCVKSLTQGGALRADPGLTKDTPSG